MTSHRRRLILPIVAALWIAAILMTVQEPSPSHQTVLKVMGPPPHSCVPDPQSSACYANGDQIFVRITTAGTNMVLSVPVKLGGGPKAIPLPPGTYSVSTNVAHLGSIEPSSFTVTEDGSSRLSFAWPVAS
jgi:hypothetical protein